ncbi:Alpha/Beta hydrolase protein [Paraphysoderma sedebokerense]|nr:Alpha/Beta hydrolase protein [Paraphysoderma sedebokerense]KAI9136505.1 Alpha/Beta hydrolase protein [Paraphysoderma sedebokerense]
MIDIDPITHPSQSQNIYISLVNNQKLAVIPSFTLESGITLKDVPVAYKTWGSLSPEGNNVMVICHALSGSADVEDWWGPLLGPGKAFNTKKFFIICCNVLGSPYGTASPVTINPESGNIYGPDFPLTTIRDDVRLHKLVLDQLGVKQVQFAIGGSMGGMQVLEWAFFGKEYVKNIIPIATSGKHSAWCISWGETQRQTIFADPEYGVGYYQLGKGPLTGLASARMQAMLTYRSRNSFESRFGRKIMTSRVNNSVTSSSSSPNSSSAEHNKTSVTVVKEENSTSSALPSNENSTVAQPQLNNRSSTSSLPDHPHNEGFGIWRSTQSSSSTTTTLNQSSISVKPESSSTSTTIKSLQPQNVFSAQSYLRYQGDKFVKRFDANCYIAITRKMDSHDISRDRGEFEQVLQTIQQPTLVIGVESDGLFTITEQYELSDHIPNASIAVIQSQDGHDGFLLEFKQMNGYIRSFLKEHAKELFNGIEGDNNEDGEGEEIGQVRSSMFGESEGLEGEKVEEGGADHSGSGEGREKVVDMVAW